MRRPLLLGGFMGTGKSTVGRKVAETTGRPFVDLDAEIERRAGTAIARIFAERGEATFRELEAQALRDVLDAAKTAPAPVVALGGGALVERPLRLAALDQAVVVTLEASPEEILARTAGSNERPLLECDNKSGRIEGLLRDRRLAYAECHVRPATTRDSPA